MAELFEPSQGAPSFTELERAISSVPGVQSATVRVAPETGRGRLRLRLVPGEDARRVSWAVAATLRERFGIMLGPEDIHPMVADHDAAEEAAGADAQATGEPDLDLDLDHDLDGDLDPPPSVDELARAVADALGGLGVLDDDTQVLHMRYPIDARVAAAPEVPTDGGARRAVIRDVTIRRDHDDVTITAILSLDGRTVAAAATGPATPDGGLRAAAEATVEALRPLTGGLLHAGIDHVTMIDGAGVPAVTVGVTVTADRTRQELLGAAMLRDGPELAVIRATLDALNRRVAPWLIGPDEPPIDPGEPDG